MNICVKCTHHVKLSWGQRLVMLVDGWGWQPTEPDRCGHPTRAQTGAIHPVTGKQGSHPTSTNTYSCGFWNPYGGCFKYEAKR